MAIYNEVQKEDVQGKRVLLRLDLNVPLEEGEILDDTRLKAALKTIKHILSFKPKKIILLAHLGRPMGRDASLSLAPVVKYLKTRLDCSIGLVSLSQEISSPSLLKIACLENLRFYTGEKQNSPSFVKRIAKLGDIFVNDAFSVMHRKHASTYGIAFERPSFIGNNALEELKNLDFSNPAHPFIIVLGGKKLKTKLAVIESLIEKIDKVLLGGAMVFTFLKAEGFEVGKSLVEKDFLGKAKELLSSGKIVLPSDVLCSSSLDSKDVVLRKISEMNKDEIGLDIGPQSVKTFASYLERSKLVFWNGAMGVFEREKFAQGTRWLVRTLMKLDARTLAGGGETIQAIKSFASLEDFDFVSLGGGACLEYIAKGTLPCLEPLKRKE